MSGPLAHVAGDSVADYGAEWIFLAVPFLVAGLVIGYLVVSGGPGSVVARIVRSLERITGLPAWSAGGIGVGILALVVAVLGFYWDVAWHIELGRDQFIFTPAHTAILLGLMLVFASALTAVVLATYARAETRIRVRSLRVPYGAVPLATLGFGALIGFPLDEFWHAAYGIDVTMWGPTHLVMISGASLTPLGLLLLLREGRPTAIPPFTKLVSHILAAASVVGMSTWTGEFDFGVPQFQALYHPILVMAGPTLALVAARHFLGRGGALSAALGALAVRGVLAVVIGAGLGLVIPRFPLYLGMALAVEVGFLLTRNMSAVRAAMVTGALVGTFGYATEWAWSFVWGRHPWTAALLPAASLGALGAVAAAVLGWTLGRILAGDPARFSRAALATAAAGLLVVLALPLPRNDADISATVRAERIEGGRANIEVALDPEDAAHGANWFEILSWQGGWVEVTPLEEVRPGVYRGASAVPVTGDWKTIVRLAKDDTLVGTPVYMPADPEISATATELEPVRQAELTRDTEFIMRESKSGPAWPALVAYSVILVLAIGWIASLTYGYSSLSTRSSAQGTPPKHRARPAVA